MAELGQVCALVRAEHAGLDGPGVGAQTARVWVERDRAVRRVRLLLEVEFRHRTRRALRRRRALVAIRIRRTL